MNIAEMRKDARRLMQMARLETDPRRKQDLAARAFELAQRAEIITNLKKYPELLRPRINGYNSMLERADIGDEQKRAFLKVIADAEALLFESAEQAHADPGRVEPCLSAG